VARRERSRGPQISPVWCSNRVSDFSISLQTGNDTAASAGGDDSISAGDGNDVLNGGSGSDTILGGDGDDRIIGGKQKDFLTGGLGLDTCDYNFDQDSRLASPPAT